MDSEGRNTIFIKTTNATKKVQKHMVRFFLKKGKLKIKDGLK